MRNITMDFGGKLALKNVNLHIRTGTIHSIVGENGAGKSTLMNILIGVLTPTAGQVELDGRVCALNGPNDAARLGIGMVHQHFMLVPMLKVWQNIILGVEPQLGPGWVDKKRAVAKIQAACRRYGTTLDLEQVVGNLTVGEQQRVEILKVLYREAGYIILDEPTAVLTPSEIGLLFASIRALKEQGKTILFISHKLEEVLSISDDISVLQQGAYVGTLKREEATSEKLVNMMVGREISIDGRPLPTERGETALRLDRVSTRAHGFGCALQEVSLEARRGEVLGVAGVDGNGQLELVESIMGLLKVTGGTVELLGRDCTNRPTNEIRRHGVACIPPDRHEQGLVLDSSLTRNTVLGFEGRKEFRSVGPLLSKRKLEQKTRALMEAFDVRYSSIDGKMSGLSGGNQQKVILARECGITDPDVILAVNPTRGLDIGAIEFVYERLEHYKAAGKCILLISTELSEVLRLSDRVAVLFHGRVMGTLENEDMDLQKVGALMMGVGKEAAG